MEMINHHVQGMRFAHPLEIQGKDTLFLDSLTTREGLRACCNVAHNTLVEFIEKVPNSDKLERKCALASYACISVTSKYKDKQKLIDRESDIIKMFAEWFEGWLINDWIWPIKFSVTPVVVDTNLYDPINEVFVGKYIHENDVYKPVAFDLADISLRVHAGLGNELTEKQKERVKLVDKVYTVEEVDELQFKRTYHLYVFLKPNFMGIELQEDWFLDKEANKQLGIELFVKEGEIPKVEISLEHFDEDIKRINDKIWNKSTNTDK